MKKIISLVLVTLLSAGLFGCSSNEPFNPSKGFNQIENNTSSKPDSEQNKEDNSVNELDKEDNTDKSTPDSSQDHQKIKVATCNLSGNRKPNAIVDIGYGNREYFAYTNEYGQLVKVEAKEITLQNDDSENVNANGRYCKDEAKVPGTENPDLDEGHIIADSLGGVSNAYNITPQDSSLNRHGEQADMEEEIRKAGGCKNFVATIIYPDNETQTPIRYNYSYTINGKKVNRTFDNYVKNNSNNNNQSSYTEKNNDEETTSKNNINIVYWTPRGKSYHSTPNCRTLSRSKTILKGTISESGKNDPCDICMN